MRCFVVLALIAGCNSGSSSSVCPGSTDPPPNGAPCDDGLTCQYPEGNGRTSFCVCQLGHLWCSDCGATAYGFGGCSAGQGCSYASWETDCDCSCTVRGTWDCVSLDVKSPCPRDPDPMDAAMAD
jgi:hypothetical protein